MTFLFAIVCFAGGVYLGYTYDAWIVQTLVDLKAKFKQGTYGYGVALLDGTK